MNTNRKHTDYEQDFGRKNSKVTYTTLTEATTSILVLIRGWGQVSVLRVTYDEVMWHAGSDG